MVPLSQWTLGSPRRNLGRFAENRAHWVFNNESDHHKKKIKKIIPQEVPKSQALSFWTQDNPRNPASVCPAFLPPSSAFIANISFPRGCEVCSREQIQPGRCEMSLALPLWLPTLALQRNKSEAPGWLPGVTIHQKTGPSRRVLGEEVLGPH